MLQPFRLALSLILVSGVAAAAEPIPKGRVRRERSVTVARSSSEAPPVIRVAGDTSTVILFSAPIQKSSLTFDETRLRVLDVGERSVIVQPLADLRGDERQEMGVFFADGSSPARAAFVLVTDPAEVDSRIDAQRPESLNSPCHPDTPMPAPRPEDFVLLGFVDDSGVTASKVKDVADEAQGLSSSLTFSYNGKGWALVDVTVWNSPDRPAWTPREATFVGRVGMPLRARLVSAKKGAILPGEDGRVLAVVELPEPKANLVFTVDVRGDGGRHLVIPNVRFPKSGAGEVR
ncbi:Myxococcus xanthus paralogous family TIGR02268 [Myxococcus fulvus]|uniref:Myxococcus xanthus paralogous family TIGR02268 n=1 Tax=Myxococcus fulvus TaxID=33 RepID=A0ABY1CRH4_MYXFU|nr:DUF2381 family protein [Myxococcus fulvus]SEU33440.1 Myxococcus xanthus paralogous family TIGR02268 [Myxococcus fulvus]